MVNSQSETVLENPLGLCYYINEYYGIPKDCIEANYNCGSSIGNGAIHDYSDGYDNEYNAIKDQDSSIGLWVIAGTCQDDRFQNL